MSVALAKVGSSAKFGVAVFKAFILNSLGGLSAKISFNNNITYYTWQIWALIVVFVIVMWGCFGSVKGVTSDMTYNANWLFTNLKLFRNKTKFPPFLEESNIAAKNIP